jgi:hypothetical protein
MGSPEREGVNPETTKKGEKVKCRESARCYPWTRKDGRIWLEGFPPPIPKK